MDVQRVPMKRQTAYKVWLKDVHLAVPIVDASGFLSFPVRDLSVVRVNVIGGVVDLFVQEGFGSMVLDDGSAQMRLKVWGEDVSIFSGRAVGDLVLVVGKVGHYNDELYLRPEIVRSVSFDWALYRRMELMKTFGMPLKEEKIFVSSPRVQENEVEPTLAARELILTTVERLEVATEEQILSECKLPREKVLGALHDLLREGEIFSPRKGAYQLV